MDLDIWIAYAVASFLLQLTPGPTVSIVVAHAVASGATSARATVPGAVCGDFVAMTVSLAGAGAILAASAALFTALKLCGAAYLVFMGVQMWRRAAGPAVASPGSGRGRRRMFWSTFAVTALNPKSIIFFVAFVPQFIDPVQPLMPQIVVLEATFLALAGLSLAAFALAAGRVRTALLRPRLRRLFDRIGGSFLIAAGAVTAAARRAAA